MKTLCIYCGGETYKALVGHTHLVECNNFSTCQMQPSVVRDFDGQRMYLRMNDKMRTDLPTGWLLVGLKERK